MYISFVTLYYELALCNNGRLKVCTIALITLISSAHSNDSILGTRVMMSPCEKHNL